MSALEQVLQLVAEGRLTAEEAAPLLEAIEAHGDDPMARSTAGHGAATDVGTASAIRIEVTDGGRSAVNLRIPLSIGRAALNHVLPGLSEGASQRIREAIASGMRGPIVDIDDGQGDGVRVVIE